MIDGSKKRNRQLAFELQNSHFCEKHSNGHRGRGRPNTTYIDTLKRDTGAFEASEIAALMADKRLWKDLVVAHLRATK